MADRYWVGGTGTWATTGTTKWSASNNGSTGASVPTLNDNVYITPSSGTGTITLTGALNCLSLVITATQNITITSTGTISVYGVITVPANITWTATGVLTQRGTGGAFTFVPIAPPLSFIAAGYTVTLGAAITTRLTTATIDLNSNLNLNGYGITCGLFSSSYTTVRSINFDSADITLVGSGINLANLTNFTWTGSGRFRSTMSTTRTFTIGTSGATSSNIPNITLVSGTSQPTFGTGSSFNELDMSGLTGTYIPLAVTWNVYTAIYLGAGTISYINVTISYRGDGSQLYANGKTVGPIIINCTGTAYLNAAQSCSTFTFTLGEFNLGYNTLTCSGAVVYASTSGQVISIGSWLCTTFTMSATVAPTFDMIEGTITCSGAFNISSGNFSYFGGTLTTTGFTHAGGTVNLYEEFNIGVTRTYANTVNQAIGAGLNLNGYNLIAGGYSASSTNSYSITVNFGGAYIVLSSPTAASSVLNISSLAYWSWDNSGGFLADLSVAHTFTCSSTVNSAIYYLKAPNLYINSGSAAATITSGSYFNLLDFTGTGAHTVVSTTVTVNNITLGGGTYTSLNITARGGYITMNGLKVALFTLDSGLNPGSTTVYLADAYWSTSFTQTSGVLDCQGQSMLLTSTYTHAAGNAPLNVSSITITGASASFVISGGSTFDVVLNGYYTYPTFTTNILTITSGTLIVHDPGSGQGSFSATGAATFTAGNITLDGSNWDNNVILSIGGALNMTGTGVRSINTNGYGIISCKSLDASILTNFTWTGGVTGVFYVPEVSGIGPHIWGITSGALITNVPDLYFTTLPGAPTASPYGSWGTINYGATAVVFPVTVGALSVYRDYILSTDAATVTAITITTKGNSSITSNGKSLGPVIMNSPGYSLTLNDTIVFGGAFTMTAGSLIAQGSYYGSVASITIIGTFTVTNGTFYDWAQSGSGIYGTAIICASACSLTNVVLDMNSNCSLTGTGVSSTLSLIGTTAISYSPYGAGLNWAGNISQAGTSSITWTASYPTVLITIGTSASNSYNINGGTINIYVSLNILGSLNFNSTTLASTLAMYLDGNGGDAKIYVGTSISNPDTTNFNWVTQSGAAPNFYMNTSSSFTWGTTGGSQAKAISLTTSYLGNTTFPAITNLSRIQILNCSNNTGSSSTLSATSIYVNTFYPPGGLNNAALFSNVSLVMSGDGSLTLGDYYINNLTINHTGTTTLGSGVGSGAPGVGLNTSTLTLTQGILDLNGYPLRVGVFTSSNTNVRGIINSSPYDYGRECFVTVERSNLGSAIDISNATNFTMTDATNTSVVFKTVMRVARTFSVGSSGGVNTTNFKMALYVISGTSIATFTSGSYFYELDLTNTTGSGAIPATSINVGTIALGAVVGLVNAYVNITFTFVYSGSITQNSKTLNNTITINGNGIVVHPNGLILGGAISILNGQLCDYFTESFTCTSVSINGANAALYGSYGSVSGGVDVTLGTLYIQSGAAFHAGGTLTFNSGFILSEGYMDVLFFASGGAASRVITGLGGTIEVTGSGATAWSVTSITNFAYDGTGNYTIKMSSASAKTFAGSGGVYGKISQAGAGNLTITGNNTFKDIESPTLPSTFLFAAGSTQTFVAFTMSGTLGNLVNLNSTSPGTTHTLSRTGGTTSVNYLSIQDSTATGSGAFWYAGANSVNVSNNSGWLFTGPAVSGITGQFMAFFN